MQILELDEESKEKWDPAFDDGDDNSDDYNPDKEMEDGHKAHMETTTLRTLPVLAKKEEEKEGGSLDAFCNSASLKSVRESDNYLESRLHFEVRV